MEEDLEIYCELVNIRSMVDDDLSLIRVDESISCERLVDLEKSFIILVRPFLLDQSTLKSPKQITSDPLEIFLIHEDK